MAKVASEAAIRSYLLFKFICPLWELQLGQWLLEQPGDERELVVKYCEFGDKFAELEHEYQ